MLNLNVPNSAGVREYRTATVTALQPVTGTVLPSLDGLPRVVSGA